jgi:GntR family transcriptional repressor for pyruvate dehydrogenase complex
MYQFKRGNLSNQVVDLLQQRIAEGQYAPGEKLPSEHVLLEEFGVSRTVVREAIASLRARGLVSAKHGVGVFVERQEPNGLHLNIEDPSVVQDAVAILELRIALEMEASALAAARRQDAHLDDMRNAIDKMSTAIANGENGVEHDLAFHRAIAESTGNPHFLKLFNYLGELLLPRTRLRTAGLSGTSAQDYLDRINGEHRQVLAAIERGDSEAARAAMRLHLMSSKQRLESSNARAADARI